MQQPPLEDVARVRKDEARFHSFGHAANGAHDGARRSAGTQRFGAHAVEAETMEPFANTVHVGPGNRYDNLGETALTQQAQMSLQRLEPAEIGQINRVLRGVGGVLRDGNQ